MLQLSGNNTTITLKVRLVQGEKRREKKRKEEKRRENKREEEKG